MLKRRAFCDVYCYDVYMKIFGWMKLEKTKKPFCINAWLSVTTMNILTIKCHIIWLKWRWLFFFHKLLTTYRRIPIIWEIRKTTLIIHFDQGNSKSHQNSPLHINSNIQNSLNSKQRPYIFMFLWYIEFLFKNDITRVKCIFA